MRRILRGVKDHPGNLPILFMPILGFVAGSWIGALIMLATFGPFYLWGAWSRGEEKDAQVKDEGDRQK